mmetsp:Transcript_41268/g.76794  ORF Transcript_41268/g.76794 Transcript_41268/m.76794 type:complete len:282 (+) Transcript_41268:50-895(+)
MLRGSGEIPRLPPMFCHAASSTLLILLAGLGQQPFCMAEEASMFLQLDLRTQPSLPPLISDSDFGYDRGHFCYLCDIEPLPGRMNSSQQYRTRADCGNHSIYEHPEFLSEPVHSFNFPGSSAYCELNHEKSCADAMYNQDFSLWAKSFDAKANTPDMAYMQWVCAANGFLSDEFLKLAHDFQAMQAKSDQLCASERYSRYDWMTISTFEAMRNYMAELDDPTVTGAERVEAYKCAMGSLGCDIAMCVYSYCRLSNGSIGIYDECEGWDPVKGMLMPSQKDV